MSEKGSSRTIREIIEARRCELLDKLPPPLFGRRDGDAEGEVSEICDGILNLLNRAQQANQPESEEWSKRRGK